ncbi:MAG: transketolase [Bacteroidetes bacterium]|nr:transketolase [Bacteroidota bacterium]
MLAKDIHSTLLRRAYSVKKRFLGMYKSVNAGHVGCSLSCAEILTYVRFGWWQEGDEIILSKGHAAASLYSVLAEAGVIDEAEIGTFYRNNTYLAAHPPTNKIKGIPFATGSLGHGLSLAAGLGLARKLKKEDKKIFCITSDGEINEGSTWEAAMFIAHHGLKNVVWLIDRNKLQGFGKTEDVMQLEPLDKKLEAFGFEVMVINGHDFVAFHDAKEKSSKSDKPVAIICNTVKGNNWITYEGMVDSHYLPMKDDQYDIVTREIERYYGEQVESLAGR